LKRNLRPLILVVLLMGWIAAPSLVSAPKPKIVAHAKGALATDVHLDAIMKNITEVDWVVVTGELKAADLTGASMLILVKVDYSLNYTKAELDAIKAWYDTGGKAIWVAGDSDYLPDQQPRIPTGNAVLEKIGSVLRFEDCEAVDPVSSAGADYRVLGVSELCDKEVDFIVAGVTRALFHGPGIVVGYSGGKYLKLEKEKPAGVYMIMSTSSNGRCDDLNPPKPAIHTAGEKGNFPLMVMQLDFAKKNVIIASSDAPFDHYDAMYMPELRNYKRYAVDYPQQGARLFKNIIDFALYYAGKMMDKQNQITTLQGQVTTLQGEKTTLSGRITTLEKDVADLKASVGTWQGISAATFVIGLVAGIAVIYMMRRR